MRAKPVTELRFNIGEEVNFDIKVRGKAVSGTGTISGVAHRRFGIFNVVVGHQSFAIHQTDMGRVS